MLIQKCFWTVTIIDITRIQEVVISGQFGYLYWLLSCYGQLLTVNNKIFKICSEVGSSHYERDMEDMLYHRSFNT